MDSAVAVIALFKCTQSDMHMQSIMQSNAKLKKITSE